MIRVLFIALLVLTSCSDGVPRIDEPENLSSKIQKILKSKGPHLIDIILDNGYD